MKLLIRLSIFLLFSFTFLVPATADNEIEIIKKNYKQILLSENDAEMPLLNRLLQHSQESVYSDQMVVELMERYPIKKERVEFLLSTIQSDGSWPDIDYNSKNRSGWLPKTHTERILELAKVYVTQNSPFYHSEEIEKNIHLTLNYWFTQKLKSPNWWHNQIGVPKILGGVFLLFEEKLTAKEKEEAIGVMKNAKFGMTGQNKVWLAGNVLVRALLENDFNLVKMARDTIVSEIRNDQKEGIKADYSFHQHGAQQQFGNYGAAYIASMSFWVQVFNKTSIAVTQPQLDILSQLINEGYSRILWKGYMDINALGRQFFNQAQLHKAFTTGFAAEALANADKKNKDKYNKLLDANFFSDSKKPYTTGLYNFWMSDLTVQRQPEWMASVKMSSKRIIGSEALNGDNLKGYYLADGATYTYVDGSEYNMYCCWDWRKIPGITSYDTNTPLKQLGMTGYHNQSDFVGNVSEGNTGMTAMDFKRDRLQAKKSWIFTEDFVLCLGAGIKSDSSCVVTTSIDQQIGKESLFLLENGKWTAKNNAVLSPKQSLRLFHDKKGYIILEPAGGKATLEERTGNWKEIMSLYPDNFTDTKKVFTLYLNHGEKPAGGSYQYMILPAKTMQEVKQFDTKTIRIISNTEAVQAVHLSQKNTFYAAMYEKGEVRLSKDINLKSHNAGLFLIKQDKKELEITVCDPTQKLKEMTFEINKKLIDIPLPQDEMKGTPVSVTITL